MKRWRAHDWNFNSDPAAGTDGVWREGRKIGVIGRPRDISGSVQPWSLKKKKQH